MGFSHEPHKAVLADFLDAIEAGRDPSIPGDEALATQRVIEDILTAGAARRTRESAHDFA
jgi:predicted dehydrogenase